MRGAFLLIVCIPLLLSACAVDASDGNLAYADGTYAYNPAFDDFAVDGGYGWYHGWDHGGWNHDHGFHGGWGHGLAGHHGFGAGGMAAHGFGGHGFGGHGGGGHGR